MFILDQCQGINRKEDMDPGIYQGCATVYTDSKSSRYVVVAEFKPITKTNVTFIELLLCDPCGSVRYQNLLMLSNGMWRNSNGKTSPHLQQLLPEEVLKYRAYKNITLSPQVVSEDDQNNVPRYLH